MKEFVGIEEYMNLTREQRRSHLVLNEPCIEIGGDSRVFRGLLAHHLGTTIGGKTCYVCHACNNPSCSNPNHLYWGTPADNVIDQKESGTWKSGYSKMLTKYGLEATLTFMKQRARSGGKSGGGHNVLRDIDLEKWKTALSSFDTTTHGWVEKVSKEMNCSHTHVRRIVRKYFPEQQTYVRKSR